MTPLLFAALLLGLITGIVGRAKGSSFLIWFLTGTLVPGIGLAAVILMRSTKNDPRRECPNCHAILPIAVQVCGRCGEDLDYPEELIAPRGMRPADDAG